MKKTLKSVMCCLLSFTALAATSCGGSGTGSGSSSTATTLYIKLDGGGLGTEWVTNAAKRFNEKYPDKSYAEGKKGIRVVTQPDSGVTMGASETSGTVFYDLTSVTSITQNVGKMLCLDDIVKGDLELRKGQTVSIEDKIPEESRARYQIDGKYYALPSVEYYPGMAYDVNLFDRYGFYFAKEGFSDETRQFTSTITNETYQFVEEPTLDGNQELAVESPNKSCGPDGEFGTADDGLPSSLYELIALCEYMKGEGVSPLNFTGQYDSYSDFMIAALTIAMQGYERASANYTFTGEIEIVTGFTDEPLFPGSGESQSIKKPQTKTIEVTEENGYYTTWSVEKYYAEAFMELCMAYDWFGSSAKGSDSQKEAQNKFVWSDTRGKEKIGMLIDGSFWYNEANTAKFFEQRDAALGMQAGLKPRKVAWMPLPVNYSETVTEGNGKGQVFLDMWRSMLVINKNIENDPELLAAATDFVKFLYTDDELSKYTATTSLLKSLDYDLNAEDAATISSYGKQLIDMVKDENNKVLYFEGNNATFNKQPGTFTFVFYDGTGMIGYNGLSYYKSRRNEVYKSAAEMFKIQSFDKEKWEGLYGGNKSVTSIDSLTSLKD